MFEEDRAMVGLLLFAGHSNRDCRRLNGLNSFESDEFCARSRMVVDYKHVDFLSPPQSRQHSAEHASILSELQGEHTRGPRGPRLEVLDRGHDSDCRDYNHHATTTTAMIVTTTVAATPVTRWQQQPWYQDGDDSGGQRWDHPTKGGTHWQSGHVITVIVC